MEGVCKFAENNYVIIMPKNHFRPSFQKLSSEADFKRERKIFNSGKGARISSREKKIILRELTFLKKFFPKEEILTEIFHKLRPYALATISKVEWKKLMSLRKEAMQKIAKQRRK